MELQHTNKLAPSKSTVYVGNLPFSLTNSDLHKIFEKYGKVVRVTIVKDKVSRRSKGIAFVLFLEKSQALECVRSFNNSEMFGRKIKASIAVDNGRAAEFIRRREYPDKSRCYECGESGHLSYACSQNILGPRPIPVKKKKINKESKIQRTNSSQQETGSDAEGSEDGYLDTWESAIRYQSSLCSQTNANANNQTPVSAPKRPRIRRDSYFSDEECLDDADDDG